jgi:hypothetical protein
VIISASRIEKVSDETRGSPNLDLDAAVSALPVAVGPVAPGPITAKAQSVGCPVRDDGAALDRLA